jgi:peptidoglycan hydrolase-like protein with peptidoglycan-binding domain
VPFRLRRTSAIVLTAAVLTGTGLVPAGAMPNRPVPFPRNPDGLTAPVAQPAGVDTAPSWEESQVTCNPVEMPGVSRLRELALRTYRMERTGGITRSCVSGGTSEHKEGRAWDWMLDVDNDRHRRVAGDFLGWLTRDAGLQARRLGVMYVIFNRRMWRTYDPARGWTPYTGSSPHTDHIHVSFGWAGARGRTSFWTGRAAGPDYGPCAVFQGQMAVLSRRTNPERCPGPAPLVRRTDRATAMFGVTGGQTVRLAQRRLGVGVTGDFDGATWTAVKRYQRKHDLPRTGVLDQPTWASLAPGSVTWSATAGYSPGRAARYAGKQFADVTLRRGSAGAAVAFLQTALDLPLSDRNGLFARRTAAAVRAFKGEHGLVRNAVVTPEVWRALTTSG